jgi:hypothetical protein
MHSIDSKQIKDKLKKLKQQHKQHVLGTFVHKCLLTNSTRKILHKTSQLQSEANREHNKIHTIYRESSSREDKLKSHINHIRSKMVPKLQKDDPLVTKFKQMEETENINLLLIDAFQEWYQNELISDKEELEMKLIDDFQGLIRYDREKMMKQIKIEKNIFDRMYDTKDKLSLIKDDFEVKNIEAQVIRKYNLELKLTRDIMKKEYKALEQIYSQQKSLNEKLIQEYSLLQLHNENNKEENQFISSGTKTITTTFSSCNNIYTMNTNNNINTTSLNTLNSYHHNTKSHTPQKDKIDLLGDNEDNAGNINDNLSIVVKYINELNQKLMKELQEIKNNKAFEIRQQSQCSQFIQRCIDDTKVDMIYLQKQIQDKEHEQKEKLNKMQVKLERLSYIYDNCFYGNCVNNKLMKKPKLKIKGSLSMNNVKQFKGKNRQSVFPSCHTSYQQSIETFTRNKKVISDRHSKYKRKIKTFVYNSNNK